MIHVHRLIDVHGLIDVTISVTVLPRWLAAGSSPRAASMLQNLGECYVKFRQQLSGHIVATRSAAAAYVRAAAILKLIWGADHPATQRALTLSQNVNSS